MCPARPYSLRRPLRPLNFTFGRFVTRNDTAFTAFQRNSRVRKILKNQHVIRLFACVMCWLRAVLTSIFDTTVEETYKNNGFISCKLTRLKMTGQFKKRIYEFHLHPCKRVLKNTTGYSEHRRPYETHTKTSFVQFSNFVGRFARLAVSQTLHVIYPSIRSGVAGVDGDGRGVASLAAKCNERMRRTVRSKHVGMRTINIEAVFANVSAHTMFSANDKNDFELLRL